MNEKFSKYQKWISDYLNSTEVDGMCAIIIFNTYCLLLQNGINVENSSWFDSRVILQLAGIEEGDNQDSLTSFHLRLFRTFRQHSTSLNINKNIARDYDVMQYELDKEKISNIKDKYHSLFSSLSDHTNLLTGCLLEAYRKYDLFTGNALFRLIIRIGAVNNESIVSAYSFLRMQQNPEGYFGFYLKKHFETNELRAILCISFDCIATILKYNRYGNPE
ncbi:hypothetical protein HPS57_10545 [Prevotella sp. PINT]|jgi:hypothetical protein|uniref:hypothetical protein n=1 Tax=Palleniella intestinalis TaxID=2736291 RepID=UPI0015567F06|nr:hypothetical protein [Palleniella intestinalis]NPD82407.1 hypothetical protein [Palleniella intestinalis]